MNYQESKAKIAAWQNEAARQQAVNIEWNYLTEIISCLREEIGANDAEDPDKQQNLTLTGLGAFCLQLGFRSAAIQCYKNIYERILEIQESKNLRIHKGHPLYWLGMIHSADGNKDLSFEYSILAFIEDILTQILNGNPNAASGAPSFHFLKTNFGVSDFDLKELIRVCETCSLSKENFSPEKIVEIIRQKHMTIPRHTNYLLYKPNLPPIKKEFDSILPGEGDKWEKLAGSVFSMIVGFETIYNLEPVNRTYQFDLFIRNYVHSDPFLKNLGDYVAIECKMFSKNPVQVADVNHFAMKMHFHGVKTGIFFTNTRLSGQDESKGLIYSTLVEAKIVNKLGMVIFDINRKDVEDVIGGKNLIDILRRKYEVTRLLL